MQAVAATSGLAGSRKRFLAFYNGVAKHAVRTVLHEHGRAHELRTFFRDLQVNETRAPGEPIEDEYGTPTDETMAAASTPSAMA